MITSEPSTNIPDQQPVAELPPKTPPPLWAHLAEAGVGIGAWVVSILLIAVVPLIGLVPYIIYRVATHTFDQAALATDKNVFFISILGVIPAHVLTFAVVWFLATRGRQVSFVKAMKLEWPERLGPVWGTAASVLIAVTLLAVGAVVTHFYGDKKTDLDLLVESSFQARWATAVVALFTAPLVEELIYRGLLYSGFERAVGYLTNRLVGMWFAVITVTIMFAGVHVWQYRNNLAVISVITLLSLTLTIVRALSDKLLPCVVIHAVFNGIQAVILILAPYLEKVDPTTPPPAPALHLFTHLVGLIS